MRADILARLLGVRLLRLEADIVLAPAAPVTPVSAAPVPVTPVRRTAAVTAPIRTGSRLGDARRLLAEAETITDPARR